MKYKAIQIDRSKFVMIPLTELSPFELEIYTFTRVLYEGKEYVLHQVKNLKKHKEIIKNKEKLSIKNYWI